MYIKHEFKKQPNQDKHFGPDLAAIIQLPFVMINSIVTFFKLNFLISRKMELLFHECFICLYIFLFFRCIENIFKFSFHPLLPKIHPPPFLFY